MHRGHRERGKEAAQYHDGQVRGHDTQHAFAVVDAGPEEGGEKVDVEQEQSQKEGECHPFGQKKTEEADGQRREDLVIAAVGKERFPFEHHEKTHHDHGERNEQAADADQVPLPKTEGLQQDGDKGSGYGEEAQRLDDVGGGVALRREGLLFEKSCEKVPDQVAHSTRRLGILCAARSPGSSGSLGP